MSWDARQRAMLEAMGYRLPVRPDAVADAASAEVTVSAPVSPPTSARARAEVPAPSLARPQATPAPVPPTALATPWSELDADGLRAAVQGCRVCALCEQRKQPVFGQGSERPQWLVVTEPPDEAMEAGTDSSAARLLTQMLAAAGLRRDQVFVTPVVKCRPPRGRAASPAELQTCQGVLARQVALFQPHVVLAMGRQAVQAVTGRNDPLGRMRGMTLSYGGRPLVATYDPSYLLRAPADKAGAWEDLCLARSLIPPLAEEPA